MLLRIVFLRSVLRLLVTADVPSSLIPFTLMMVAICFYEMPVLTTATRRNTTEYGILRSHRRENLKSHIINQSARLCSGDVLCLL
jgi:hypothetical protein